MRRLGLALVPSFVWGVSGAIEVNRQMVNAVILRPLPYPDPGRLVVLWGNVKRVRVERRGASYPDFRDWRALRRRLRCARSAS